MSLIYYIVYISNVRKILRKKLTYDKDTDGKVLEGAFNILFNESKLFHLYHFEVYVKK